MFTLGKCTPEQEDKARKIVIEVLWYGFLLFLVLLVAIFTWINWVLVLLFSLGLIVAFFVVVLSAWLEGGISFCKKDE